MGEAGRETRKGAAVEATEPRCIYCAGPSETAERMPPLGLLELELEPNDPCGRGLQPCAS